MKRSLSKWWLLAALPLAALAGTIWIGCHGPGSNEPPASTGSPAPPLFCAPGLVEPESQVVELRAERSGRLVEVCVHAGDSIQKGTVLARLDGDILEAQLHVREKERDAARAQLRERIAEQENLERTLKRQRALTEEGVTHEADLEDVETACTTAAARVGLAEANVAAAEARLSLARVEQSKTILYAPMDGRVVYRHRHPGEQVSPADPIPILELASHGPLYVRVDVDEFDIAHVQVGQNVYVTASAYGDRKIRGVVVRQEPILGRKNFRSHYATERKDVKVREVVVRLEESDLPLGLPVRTWFLPFEAKAP